MRNYALHQASQFDRLPDGGLLRTIWTNWQARQAVRQLQNLDDHLLSDIGVDRTQVELASDVSLYHNAADQLILFRHGDIKQPARETPRKTIRVVPHLAQASHC